MRKTIKGIMWDMGGVILRTEFPEYRETLAKQFGITRHELEQTVFNSESSIQSELGQISDAEHYANMARQFGLPVEKIGWLMDHYWAGDRVDWDLVDYIDKLRPTYKTALLSNAWQNARKIFGERFGFLHAFDVVTYSSEVGVRKPDRAIFELTACNMGLTLDDCVFIDDFIINIEGAQKIGLRAIHFQNKAQVMKELGESLGR